MAELKIEYIPLSDIKPFAFFGQMPVKTLAVMCISQVGLKTLYETIMLPMTNLTVRMVNKYERN